MRILLFLFVSLLSVVYGREKPSRCILPQISSKYSNSKSNSDKNSRIAGGDLAAEGQFPWHVHMVLHDDFGLKICSGGLIGPKWVLTVGV